MTDEEGLEAASKLKRKRAPSPNSVLAERGALVTKGFYGIVADVMSRVLPESF